MARPLRVEYPGAHYHVMNRGNQRMAVFRSVADYECFLERLERFAEQFWVRVFCYCLMPNHFHLHVRTEEANLSRFMQSLLTAFTASVNRVRRSSGHLFQGRFKAHLVEAEGYHTVLTRYIHLNPVRVAQQWDRPVKERRESLRRFKWSSYTAYIGLRKAPGYLTMGPVLSQFSGTRREQMRRYRRYVEEGLLREMKSPYAQAEEQTIVGSDGFIDRIKREYLLARQADRREEPSLTHLQQSLVLGDAVAAVCEVYGVERECVLQRAGAHRQARRVLMYCASRYCRYQSSLTELGRALGVSVSGLTRARDRVAAELPKNRRLRATLQNIEGRLGVSGG